MKQQLITDAIILTRVDYGEADRILTFITPSAGKVRVIARGVRRIKSKLAGGIELFSISNITYINGRGEIGTLISARLIEYYSKIPEDYERTMLAYDLIKILNQATEDNIESSYFYLLKNIFELLNNFSVPIDLIFAWFIAQILKINGHSPNLRFDIENKPLQNLKAYEFIIERMTFAENNNGRFNSNHIKLLRMLFNDDNIHVIERVKGYGPLIAQLKPLIQAMLNHYVRL